MHTEEQSQSAADLVNVVKRIQIELLRLRSVATALRLAALEEDRTDNKVRIYWPDVLEAVEALAPKDDALDPLIDFLARVRSQQQQAPRTPASRRAAVAERASA